MQQLGQVLRYGLGGLVPTKTGSEVIKRKLTQYSGDVKNMDGKDDSQTLVNHYPQGPEAQGVIKNLLRTAGCQDNHNSQEGTSMRTPYSSHGSILEVGHCWNRVD